MSLSYSIKETFVNLIEEKLFLLKPGGENRAAINFPLSLISGTIGINEGSKVQPEKQSWCNLIK